MAHCYPRHIGDGVKGPRPQYAKFDPVITEAFFLAVQGIDGKQKEEESDYGSHEIGCLRTKIRIGGGIPESKLA
jgi:hypothetical protein